MKLLYCIPSLENCGGTERVLTTRLNYLASHSSNEIYIVLTEHQSREPYFRLDPKITVINLNVDFESDRSFISKILNYKKRLRVYKNKLNSILEQVRPDILTSLLSHEMDIISHLAFNGVKIGENHFNRDFRYSFVKNNTKNPIRRCIARFRNYQLGKSVSNLDALVSLTKEDAMSWNNQVNSVVIPNPLSFSSATKSSYESNKIIAVGRFTPQKGFDLLLKAWKIIYKKFPDWELAIYGSGPEEINLHDYIVSQDLKRVVIHPFTKDIVEKYIESDFLVVSSRFEGFGLVIIEAMECGLPVISFDCKSGPKDIITNEVDGYLVKAGDIELLAKAISNMISNPNQIKSMGENAIIKAQQYRLDNIMGQWINLYDQLVQKRTIRP